MKSNSINAVIALTAPYVFASVCCKLFKADDFYKSIKKGFDGHPLKAVNDFYHKPGFGNFIDFLTLAVATPGINCWALNSKSRMVCSAAVIFNLVLCFESVRGVAGVGAV